MKALDQVSLVRVQGVPLEHFAWRGTHRLAGRE
jgi:hypothetical protein